MIGAILYLIIIGMLNLLIKGIYGKTYKYHIRLLALYGNLSSKYVKTRNALKDIDVEFEALEDYWHRKNIKKISYYNLLYKISNPSRSDTMSNQWRMTLKEFLVLVEKFNVDLTDEQKVVTAKYLLKNKF